VLVKIVETYMTPDYYVGSYGAETQAGILQKILTLYDFLPKVVKAFERLEVNFVTFSVSWFVTIFSASLPEEASLRVLDLFFLKGLKSSKVVFEVGLGILKVLEN